MQQCLASVPLGERAAHQCVAEGEARHAGRLQAVTGEAGSAEPWRTLDQDDGPLAACTRLVEDLLDLAPLLRSSAQSKGIGISQKSLVGLQALGLAPVVDIRYFGAREVHKSAPR
ncbi:hypothetical protein [Nocardiopsis rhodophaea]|uniref:hypothetical protein n=1 Tax=Nocardiopsis rhodophaea TaxID=280238 RepID=UPI0031D9660B